MGVSHHAVLYITRIRTSELSARRLSERSGIIRNFSMPALSFRILLPLLITRRPFVIPVVCFEKLCENSNVHLVRGFLFRFFKPCSRAKNEHCRPHRKKYSFRRNRQIGIPSHEFFSCRLHREDSRERAVRDLLVHVDVPSNLPIHRFIGIVFSKRLSYKG